MYPPRAAGGFTLTELLVALVIIGILATVVTVNVVDHVSRSRVVQAKDQIAELSKALDVFRIERHRYPTNEEGLAVLAERTADHPNGIIQAVPLDPWGRKYQYLCPGEHAPYEVYTLGADNLPGGDGENQDVFSYELARSQEAP